MSELVRWTSTWTVEDKLRFPSPKLNARNATYGQQGQRHIGIDVTNSSNEWEVSAKSPFSMDKIGDKDFAFKNTDFFFRPEKEFLPVQRGMRIPGLESAKMEILHKKDDPIVYLQFQTNKAIRRCDWGELDTLHFEVSFKSKDRGETKGLKGEWQTIKAFDVPLSKPDGAPDCPCQEKGLELMAELCPIDVFKGYVISYHHPQFCHHFRLELPIQVFVKISKDPIVPDHRKHRIWNTNPMNVMKKLLFKALHSDFTIHVGEKTFPCHKGVLAGQSEVFAAMLDSKMSEANSNQLEIRDMSAAGVGALLKYLYYKGVDDPVSSSAIAFELLQAANKYQIMDLELESRSILSSISAEKFDAKTAFELFEFCGMVDGFKDGQEKAARVFKENAKKYNETGEFTAVLNNANLEVAAKLMEIMASL